jgi:hypothetical protein
MLRVHWKLDLALTAAVLGSVIIAAVVLLTKV